MALTDNNFTAQELEGALTANPALADVLTSSLPKAGFVIHRKEDFDKTVVPALETQITSKLTSEHAKRLEADVLAITGIPKASADEKYYDYFKRATGEVINKRTALENELTELRKTGNPTEADKKRIETLEKAIEDKNTEIKTKLQAKDETYTKKLARLTVATEVAGFRGRYRKDLPEDLVKVVENQIIEQLANQVKFQADETPTFLGPDGTPLLDKVTFKPVTISQRAEEMLKSLLEEQHTQQGAGSTGNTDIKPGGDNTLPPQYKGVPGDVKTRVALSDHLLRIGIPHGPDHDKILATDGAKLPLR